MEERNGLGLPKGVAANVTIRKVITGKGESAAQAYIVVGPGVVATVDIWVLEAIGVPQALRQIADNWAQLYGGLVTR